MTRTRVLLFGASGLLVAVLAVLGESPGWLAAAALSIPAAAAAFLAKGTSSVHRIVTSLGRLTAAALVVLPATAALGELDASIDLTANQALTLSEFTEDVLELVEDDLEVTVFYPAGTAEAAAVRDLLAQYRLHAPQIDVRFVDPTVGVGSVSEFDDPGFGTIAFVYRGRRSQTRFPAEIEMTSAILRVVRERSPTVCNLHGHGERNLEELGPRGLTTLVGETERVSIGLVALDLAEDHDGLAGCDALLIVGPATDPLEDERERLLDWVADQGKVALFTDPGSDADWSFLTKPWGIEPHERLVLDPGASIPGDPLTLLVDRFPSANLIAEGLSRVMMAEVAPATVASREDAGLVVSVIATASGAAQAVLPRTSEHGDEATTIAAAEAVVAAAADASRVAGTSTNATIERTRVAWFGDSDWITNALIDNVQNADLALNTLAWLVAEEDLIGIGAPPVDLRRLLLTTDQHERLFLATSVALPSVAVLTGGLVVGLRRRRSGR